MKWTLGCESPCHCKYKATAHITTRPPHFCHSGTVHILSDSYPCLCPHWRVHCLISRTGSGIVLWRSIGIPVGHCAFTTTPLWLVCRPKLEESPAYVARSFSATKHAHLVSSNSFQSFATSRMCVLCWVPFDEPSGHQIRSHVTFYAISCGEIVFRIFLSVVSFYNH